MSELEKLRRKLASLEPLRDVLGDEAVEQAKAELEVRIRLLVQTGGGAVVGGDVDFGDFAGRALDKIAHLERLVLEVPPAGAGEAILEQAYLCRVLARCNHLPLAIIDPKYVSATGTACIALSDLYGPLDVTVAA